MGILHDDYLSSGGIKAEYNDQNSASKFIRRTGRLRLFDCRIVLAALCNVSIKIADDVV